MDNALNNIRTFLLGFVVTTVTAEAIQNFILALVLAFTGGFLSLLGRMACNWVVAAIKQKTWKPKKTTKTDEN